MATILDEFAIKLSADTRQVRGALDRMDKRFGRMGKVIKRLGVALGGLFAISTLKRWASETSRWALEVDRLAREFRISNREAQELMFLADATGTSLSSIRDAAFEIRKRFGEIGENKAFRETMEKLGMSPEFAKRLKATDLLYETLFRISELPLEEQEKALDSAFGGDAAKNLNLLVKNEELLVDLLERGSQLPAIDTASILKANIELANVKAQWKAISAELLNKVLPYIQQFTDYIRSNKEELIAIGKTVVAVGAKVWNYLVTPWRMIDRFFQRIANNWQSLTSGSIGDRLSAAKNLFTGAGDLDYSPSSPLLQLPAPNVDVTVNAKGVTVEEVRTEVRKGQERSRRTQ